MLTTHLDFREAVLALAHLSGWTVHPLAARRLATPRALVLSRGRDLTAALLTAEGEGPTPEQRLWRAAFQSAGIEVHAWGEDDWGAVVEVLR